MGNLSLTFLGNGTIDFATNDSNTLQNMLLGTINGFAAHNGIIDFSKIAFNANDMAVYDSSSGQLALERASGTVLANVFLNTSGNFSAGFNLKADSTNHLEVTVAPTRLA